MSSRRMKVLKFGGSSVATAPRRATVAGLVARAAAEGPVTVVTSALGGVTDLLQRAIRESLEDRRVPDSLLREIERRHLVDDGLREPLEQRLRTLRRLLEGVALLGQCPPATRHDILASGERLALPLVASALRLQGLEVRCFDGADLLVTDSADRAEPTVDPVASRCRVEACLGNRSVSRGMVHLVTGFVAADVQGRTTTLGRGASDLSATLLADLLDADCVEIWSDVDGVLSAPPAWVEHAATLPRLSYAAAADLARFGAKVLHPLTLEPLERLGIPVWIRNTLRPSAPGTRIDPVGDGTNLTAVTALEDATLLQFTANDLARLGHVSPLLWVHGSDRSMAAVVRPEDADMLTARAVRHGITLPRTDDVTVVAAVAHGPQASSSLASTVHGLLDDAGLPVLAIALPTTTADRVATPGRYTVAAVVSGRVGRRAVSLLHAELKIGIGGSEARVSLEPQQSMFSECYDQRV